MAKVLLRNEANAERMACRDKDETARIVNFLQRFTRPDLNAVTSALKHRIHDYSTDEMEVECRLCTPLSDSRRAFGPNTNIPKETWTTLLNYMSKNMKPSFTRTLMQRYGKCNENIVSTQALTGNTAVEFGQKEFRLKRKLGTMDIHALGTPFDLRLAASLELPLANAPADADATQSFAKARWSFMLGMLRCDFTMLTPVDTIGEPIHQVEIEIAHLRQMRTDGITASYAWSSITDIVKLLSNAADESPCTQVSYTPFKQKLYTRCTT